MVSHRNETNAYQSHEREVRDASSIRELTQLDDLWNAESESFASNERIGRKQKVRLPVSAHGRRGRPSQETRACSRVRHRISQQAGGMHKRRRKTG